MGPTECASYMYLDEYGTVDWVYYVTIVTICAYVACTNVFRADKEHFAGNKI